MTSTIVPAMKKIVEYPKINIIDVGAARASFLVELDQLVDLSKVFAIGIDPIDHGISEHYDKFYNACIDNVDSPTEMDFYLNIKDDQASSLCVPSKGRLNKYKDPIKVQVLNLNHIINDEIPDEIIHFLKIDAEGKDLHIVKSLDESILERIKYIAIECPMTHPRHKGELIKDECIKYFESIGFETYFTHDTDNDSDVSDVVFVNTIDL